MIEARGSIQQQQENVGKGGARNQHRWLAFRVYTGARAQQYETRRLRCLNVGVDRSHHWPSAR
ncbi:hypothetical protein BGLA2_190036 [Burkholderia gladioli]|nr:hypothetical protein BGLA2_190036 [Burkholderia gladioli]